MYRNTNRVSDQCIDDTYHIIDTIHKTILCNSGKDDKDVTMPTIVR